MLAYPPSKIEVVSPTRVAAPSRFENIDIARIIITGDIFNLRATLIAIGAIISTVATLSMKALINPLNTASAITAHLTLGILSIIISAIRSGILD